MRYAIQRDVSPVPVVYLTDWPQVRCDLRNKEIVPELLTEAFIDIAHAYIQQRKPIPLNKSNSASNLYLYLNANIVQKVLLHNLTVARGFNRTDLAKFLGVTLGEVQRMFNMRMTTTPDVLVKAFTKLGYAVQISLIERTLKDSNELSEN